MIEKKRDQSANTRSSRAFLDYYLCPNEFARFCVTPQSHSFRGYFRFGNATCYGNLAESLPGNSPNGSMFNALASTKIDSNGAIHLPFDLNEIIDNFRLERYVDRQGADSFLQDGYYFLRPLLPLAIRKRIQRLVFRRRLSSKFPTWPVDCSVEQVLEQMMALAIQSTGASEIPFIWFWPDGKYSGLTMTHDVEGQKGADYCDSLMDLDDSYKIKAAFQLIPEGAYKCFDSLVSKIQSRGFETNIHDLDHDGRLYEQKERFQRRATKINAYGRQYGIKGFRSGSMHRNQEWFNLLNFQYDMSVPTVSHLEPQKGGCCTVTPYFVDEILELPLTTIQDHGMFHVLSVRSLNLWQQQIEAILAHYGLISFIVHPDYITNSAEREQYRQLLEYIARLRDEGSIWVALPAEINSWWRERSQLQLVPVGGSWEVRGRGSERACVAFATLVNGKVTYRIKDHSQS